MTYDCVVIGGGIAGLTAALYASRGGLKTLVIEKQQVGGQIINSLNVENYPGYSNISGFALIEEIKKQILELGVEILNEEVISLSKSTVITSTKEINFKTAIIASGLKRRELGIESRYVGAGVSYCATCDGNFFKNQDVCVVGGGNTALEDALYLAKIAKKVYLVHRRDSFRAANNLVFSINATGNIKVIYNAEVKALAGNQVLETVELTNGDILNVSGLFIAIGALPDTDYLKDLVATDSDGFVVSNDTTTNVGNIFVAGDVRTKQVRQLVTASSDGAIAATNCINYLHLNS